MKAAGIIVEYNPFHKGHQYHIEETRRLTGADYIVAVMSGDFTQRGIPACLDKFTRAECALSCGADVVLELPFCYSVGSAEYFAAGAVSVLDKLGIIDSLCFGSETAAPVSLFTDTAAFLCEEPPAYRTALKEGLRAGLTFPKARLYAARGFLSEDALALLSSPNSLLGIEYCKALYRRNSSVTPYVITRAGSGYHDVTPAEEGFSSATFLRGLLTPGTIFPETFLSELPEPAAEILRRKPYAPVFAEDFLLLYRTALHTAAEELSLCADVSPELAARLSARFPVCDYEAFLAHLKTKQYTRTRIERCLLHILFRLHTETLDRFRQEDIGYARILGFRESAAPLLKHMKKTAALPVITKLAQKDKRCNALENELLSFDIAAADCYNRVAYQKYGVLLPDDFSYIITNAKSE
ncbi:MAG: nucleotidyltransferase family protein [Lachnospiraceae bacterium]|nr:nucleotidyltransferase family protein [Lachnospiraceae bacterium]